MEAINLIDSFAEFKELKNIDRATLMRVLEDIFRNMLIKRYGTDENFDIIINIDKGDLEIWRNRIVVEDDAFENPNTQISLTEANRCRLRGGRRSDRRGEIQGFRTPFRAGFKTKPFSPDS